MQFARDEIGDPNIRKRIPAQSAQQIKEKELADRSHIPEADSSPRAPPARLLRARMEWLHSSHTVVSAGNRFAPP